jgi:hypothetical protein
MTTKVKKQFEQQRNEMMIDCFKYIANNNLFNKHWIRLNRNNTICIKIREVGTNYFNFNNENEKYGIQYQIGFNINTNKFWIRRQNGAYQFPLHYNRNTGDYGFNTWKETYEYFINFWNKHKPYNLNF